MDKMRVWTRQDSRVLDILNSDGVYRCRSEFIDLKMENFSSYYKKLYDWYASRAEAIVPKPSDDIKYPVWVSIDEAVQLRPVPGTVVLELEVDEELLVITDLEKWGYVVNFFYLPRTREDLNKHDAELKRFGIGDESALISGDKGNFYPLLKQKIMKSWDRLFEDYMLSNIRQATIWEIKKEWIVNVFDGGE